LFQGRQVFRGDCRLLFLFFLRFDRVVVLLIYDGVVVFFLFFFVLSDDWVVLLVEDVIVFLDFLWFSSAWQK
jgi:hypothetical protein